MSFQFVFAQDLLPSVSGKVPGGLVTVIGNGNFVFHPAVLTDGHGSGVVSSNSNNLLVGLKDISVRDGQLFLTLSLGTSVSADDHSDSSAESYDGAEGLYTITETFVFQVSENEITNAVDWDHIRISFGDLFFVSHYDDGRTVCWIADGYDWAFIFHNPKAEADNHDGLVLPMDEKGIHTFGNSVEVDLLGGIVFGSSFSFDLVRQSDMLTRYLSEGTMWYNGEPETGEEGTPGSRTGGGTVLNEDVRFMYTDHFVYDMPEDLAYADNLSVYIRNAAFEMTYSDENGTHQTLQGAITDETAFPKELVRFNWFSFEKDLPQPDDPVLVSVSEKGVTVDLVSLDLVRIPKAQTEFDRTNAGAKEYMRAGFCFTAPDDADWHVIPGRCAAGDKELWGSYFVFGGALPAGPEKPGKLCAMIYYDAADQVSDWNVPLTLEIRELFAQPREGDPCEDILRRFETNAAAQALGIGLICREDPKSGDDYIRTDRDYILEVAAFDPSRGTREEFQTMAEEILDPHIVGNWTLRIDDMSKIEGFQTPAK